MLRYVWTHGGTSPHKKNPDVFELIIVPGFLCFSTFSNNCLYPKYNPKALAPATPPIINKLIKFNDIKTEVRFSNNTRFDFLLQNNKEKCFLEVKNVTLVREKKMAEFPDAVTSRGTKHLNELCNAKKKGYQSYILYLIQREDCDSFKIAKDIDKKYKTAFDKALKSGVKILCYDCKLSNEEIKLNNQINYEY